jgi:hypothetical protein
MLAAKPKAGFHADQQDAEPEWQRIQSARRTNKMLKTAGGWARGPTTSFYFSAVDLGKRYFEVPAVEINHDSPDGFLGSGGSSCQNLSFKCGKAKSLATIVSHSKRG